MEPTGIDMGDYVERYHGFTLEVAIEQAENVWPLVPPGASNAEMMEERWDEPLDSY